MANEIHTLNVGNTSYTIQPRVLGPMSTYSNGVPCPSVSGVIRYDTAIGDNPFGPNKSDGMNNAVLSISRGAQSDTYTTQLGFSRYGIYGRWFYDKTPDTITPWRRFIMDDGFDTLHIDTPSLNIANNDVTIQTNDVSINADDVSVQASIDSSITADNIVVKSITFDNKQFPNTLYGRYIAYYNAIMLKNYKDPEISSIMNVQADGHFYNTGYILGDLRSPLGNSGGFSSYANYYVFVPYSCRNIILNYYLARENMVDWGARLEDDDYQTFINDEVTPLSSMDPIPIILLPTDITTAHIGGAVEGCKIAHLKFSKYIINASPDNPDTTYYNFNTNIIIAENLQLYDIDVYVTSGVPSTKFFEVHKNPDNIGTGNYNINIGSQPVAPNGYNVEESYSPDITIHGRSINLCADSFGNITLGGDLYYPDDNGPIVLGRPHVVIDATVMRPHFVVDQDGGTILYATNLGGKTTRFSELYVKDADIEYEVKVGDKVSATNGFFQTSDERLKNFGDNIKVDFDALSKLRKAYFTWNDNPDTTHIGVSAQEVQEIYPEVVTETDGQLSVDYTKLSVVALAAVDELHKKNVELESRLAKLEALLLK